MLNRAATVGASTPVVQVLEVFLFVIHHVHLDSLGDGVSAGSDTVLAKAGWLVTGDADHLLDRLTGLNS